MMTNKIFYMLCGVPGSGKTTWVNQLYKDYSTSAVIRSLSTDDIIDDIGRRYGLTYNEVFGDITYSFAEKIINKLAPTVFERADIVIWDQTNLTVKSRAKKLLMVPSNFQKIAIVFEVPEHEELHKRLNNRPGKSIPNKVLNNMIGSYIHPTKTEGFSEIRLIK